MQRLFRHENVTDWLRRWWKIYLTPQNYQRFRPEPADLFLKLLCVSYKVIKDVNNATESIHCVTRCISSPIKKFCDPRSLGV